MILNFKDNRTQNIFDGNRVKGVSDELQKQACRKLDMINYADVLDNLRVPPGNKLEALKGNYKGYYSIRINSQWRIIFKWQGKDASDVQIIDYH